ncbi:hypothetical protein [Paenibacillus sp.]|uniref:hypothetical protein n=1 Tax=Paenibacillus sp. TaxID=58172 RepID=UPI002D54FFC8|nr:hypothetical protein [Paenibacillus sp.]HZG56017.1 hypothetical protein [Paenibacillus sp.]
MRRTRWFAAAALAAAMAAALAGCGGAAGSGDGGAGRDFGALGAGAQGRDPARFGMQLYAAGERHPLSADDFLVVGNSVFVADDASLDARSDEVQQNFRGMRIYILADASGRAAMHRLRRAMAGGLTADNAPAAAADFAALLRGARLSDDGGS